MGYQDERRTPLSPGRPKAVLDVGLLLRLQCRGYGSKRIAREYRELTGQYVSHMTVLNRLSRSKAGVTRSDGASSDR